MDIDDAVVIYCDNTATIAYAKDTKYHGRTKHIDTRYHFIRDVIAQGEVVLRHIPINDMIVNPFTKPLSRDAFHKHMTYHEEWLNGSLLRHYVSPYNFLYPLGLWTMS
ncbi:UNVERIFIED_CONTAM: Retrovirus-related Pol polyprotein from transposon TNT 1-94 [Sesamum calycinum]|uniref:Retrovirus-related Pol polyprotein from transposon TNT 1-94 n=1 Tax=Sesamum calycinum TaxID=2727403 RepID=A0AAW2LTB6_9LAMI